jgi:hypothetical protein
MPRQLSPRLLWKLWPQAWRYPRHFVWLYPALGSPMAGRDVVHRLRAPHFSKRAQRGRDSPKAEACAPKYVIGDSMRPADHRLIAQDP